MASSPNGPDPGPATPPPPAPVRVSVVVPVYRGELTLESLIAEIVPLVEPSATPAGTRFAVCEIVLVHDGAVDGSSRVIKALAAKHPFVLPLWLSRNFGQHAATLAGMASTTGDWVVTLDEDGQHNPRDIAVLLDEAIASGTSLVYGRPVNPPPHGWIRNLCSRGAKRLVSLLIGNNRIALFQSYRLVDGEVARSLAAYCGQGVYLDIALGWVVDKVSTAPVTLRKEGDRASGYNYLKLLSHFWRLVLTAGTRPLRMIALLGAFSMLVAIGLTVKAFIEKWLHQVPVAGWTSLIVVLSFFSGVILFSLSVIAEYMGLTLNMAMGRPAYLVVGQPPRPPSRAR
jgi:undecaprenyl-phosphate 4-deoxy-4-formamido-L-arabinose transferase